MTDAHPGRLRRVITQQLELVSDALRQETIDEHVTQAQFHLAAALQALEQYWDGRGIIPSSASLLA